MKFKAEPCEIFKTDDSALALYGRRRWLNGTGNARSLSRSLVRDICSSQLKDGSWEGQTSSTICNMFSLWLLCEKDSKTIQRGIDWLTQRGQPSMQHESYQGMYFHTPDKSRNALNNMNDVPFTPGCSGFIKSGAAMFFACEYGRQDEPHIAAAFNSAKKLPAQRNGKWCAPSCGENIFLAFTSHPKLSGSPGVRKYLEYLEKYQEKTGRFGNRTPFIPVLWGLSRLKSKAAKKLFDSALPSLQKSQRKNGCWGTSKAMINAFMVMDALERQKIKMEWNNNY